MLVTQRTATIRLIPAIIIRVTVTPIQATDMAMAVRITALIGAITDALLAELIGDGTAGTEKPSLDWLPARTQHRMKGLRPRLIAGVQGSGRGLAQPSDNPTLRLPGATLTFNERDIE